MPEKISITNLSRLGTRGWSWTMRVTFSDGHFTMSDYYTDANGEGLWKNNRQIKGVCQFWLPQDAKASRTKITSWAKSELGG